MQTPSQTTRLSVSYDCCAKQEKETELATPAFGKTWWGEQWLNTLTHIDYDNRLPRGLGGSVQALAATNCASCSRCGGEPA